MPDLEGYGYKGVHSSGQTIGFGPLKGLDTASDLTKTLAYARTADEYVVDADDTIVCGLTWEPIADERVDVGISIQGIASQNANIRIEVTKSDAYDVVLSTLVAVSAGVVGLAFPMVLDKQDPGNARYRLRLRCDAGTLTLPPGSVAWFVQRKG